MRLSDGSFAFKWTEVVRETSDMVGIPSYRFQGSKLEPQISEKLGSQEIPD